MAADVCLYDLSNTKQDYKNTIGTPISNIQIHILDEYLNKVPIESIGELYIGGVGLARGYLNRPSLTAERFIPNPYATEEEIQANTNLRLYRTGDLGRYLVDGNIEFLGRIDHQVKIRGFRIELGEIESIIQGTEGIKQSVVLAREDMPNQKRLVAYVVPNEKENKEPQNELIDKIRQECKGKLPDYMQPSQIMVLEILPLTPNGKIDRKALLAPGTLR